MANFAMDDTHTWQDLQQAHCRIREVEWFMYERSIMTSSIRGPASGCAAGPDVFVAGLWIPDDNDGAMLLAGP